MLLIIKLSKRIKVSYLKQINVTNFLILDLNRKRQNEAVYLEAVLPNSTEIKIKNAGYNTNRKIGKYLFIL